MDKSERVILLEEMVNLLGEMTTGRKAGGEIFEYNETNTKLT